MSEAEMFAERVRAAFPEGLTTIAAIGGTRTSYLLSRTPDQIDPNDPGAIGDPHAYATWVQDRYKTIIRAYFDLGGQNLIIPVLSYQSFVERGEEYARRYARFVLWLIDTAFLDFYREMGIDPYFCGIDTLLHLPPGDPARSIGEAFDSFQRSWDYQPGHCKLIWEVVPMPFYSFWMAHLNQSAADREALQVELATESDLGAVYRTLYRFYVRAALGTDVPVPHIYIGTNRNGDIKLRAPLSLSLLCGGAFRTFYTPYPSLFMTEATLRRIIEDVMTGGGLRAFKPDYSNQYTAELFAAERARVLTLRDDPESTLGLLRRAESAPPGSDTDEE